MLLCQECIYHCKTFVKFREIHLTPTYSKFRPHTSILSYYKPYQNHVLEHAFAKLFSCGPFHNKLTDMRLTELLLMMTKDGLTLTKTKLMPLDLKDLVILSYSYIWFDSSKKVSRLNIFCSVTKISTFSLKFCYSF